MQRQLAIQRLQEQEKERQMRLEQQKQTIQMRAQMPAFSLPYAQARAPALPAPAGLQATGSHPDSRPFLSPAPDHACSGRRAVPALWPHQLSGDLQPGRLGGGLPHAHRVPEPASPGRRRPLPQRAGGRSR